MIVDLSPQALAVYSLTLIGTTFDRATVSQLWASAAATTICYAMLVIKRHDAAFVVQTEAYVVTLVLMVISIVMLGIAAPVSVVIGTVLGIAIGGLLGAPKR